MRQVKVLLVQLASNGDCLFVTAIAKQIKEINFPGCHLSWLIGSKFSQVLRNNPYVDAVLEVPITTTEEMIRQRNSIDELVAEAGGYNKFDKIFITDYSKANFNNWFGTTRSSLFRNYPYKLKVNPQPIIFLSDHEKKKVSGFCEKNKLTESSYNVLFECAPQSGQSLMSFDRARSIANKLVAKHPEMKFILSSNQPFVSDSSNIIDGSVVSWRENAELAGYCNLLVGCSSGISWLCTSASVKSLPFIQVINPSYMGGVISASMKTDFRYFGLDTETLIELHNAPDEILEECILAGRNNNFKTAKRKYDVNDNSAFSNFRFLKGAKMKIFEKAYLFIRYCVTDFLYKKYIRIKPDWFKPVVWIKNHK